jgi:uncharacterized protein with PIN domain
MSIISDLQVAAKVIKKTGEIELYQKLLEHREKIVEIIEENNTLKQKIEKLEKILKIKGSIIFERQVYWLEDKEKNIIEGPFCPKCYDDEKLFMHLIASDVDPNIKRCPRCRFTRMKL